MRISPFGLSFNMEVERSGVSLVQGLEGVLLRKLAMHRDDRGVFTEVHRAAWDIGSRPLQWNVVTSCAGVLRGVHVHLRHHDYLTILQGRATIGLRDLRRDSPSFGGTAVVEMTGEELKALSIPPGVAHGFYFHVPAVHLYAVSEYWNPDDELGCHWADPALKIDWPVRRVQLSERDAAAPTFSELLEQIEPWQPTIAGSRSGRTVPPTAVVAT